MRQRVLLCASLLAAIMFAAGALHAGLYEQGRQHYNRKKYDQAKELFLRAAEKEGNGNALYFVGEIEKSRGNLRDAEGYYRAAIEKKAIDRQYLVNAYWNALLMAEQRGDYEGVVLTCRSMWARTRDAGARQKIESLINKFLWTDHADAVKRYQEGIGLKKRGAAADAQEKFRSALSLDSSFLAPKFELGMMAYNRGDLDVAAGYLDDVADRITFYAEVNHVLGDIEFARRRYREAIDRFDRVLRYGFIDADAEYRIRMKRGTCYYNLDEYGNAAHDIERALKHNGRSLEALLLMSAIQIRMDRNADALKLLQRAHAISPDEPEVLYQMGSVHYKENDESHARYFDRLFANEGGKKDVPARYQKVFIILAKHHYGKGAYEKSLAIARSFDEGSRTFETRLLAGKSLFGLKKYDDAIAELESISPGNEDRYLLCRAYALSGRREKARALLSELANAGDYLSRARRDAALSGIAREIEAAGSPKSGNDGPTPAGQ